jgi:uncharacterized membrane protein
MTADQDPFQADGWDWAAIGVTASQLSLAAYIALFGPRDPVALHFDLMGRVDGWGSRFVVCGILMAMAGLTLVTALAARRPGQSCGISPARSRSQNIPRFILLVVMLPLTLLMSALGMGQMRGGGDPTLNVHIILAVVWIIITALGAVLGKLAPNRLAGVRTYWSLRSPLAWEKSNRLLGRIYLAGGLFGLLTSTFLQPPVALTLLMAVGIGGGFLATFESWRVWRSDPERKP